MRKIIVQAFFIFIVIFLSLPTTIHAYVSVKGYYRSNGTYVAPYVRSNPNGLKYDNYSYTPSQGLYNTTYGTRGTYWDTPTYITDPDYYIGQSLYNSNNTNSYYTPSYNTAYTSSYYSSVINNCPLNSSQSTTDSTKCTCNSGYTTNFDKNGCISPETETQRCIQANNGANVIWDGTFTDDGRLNCGCVSGYQWNGKSCVVPTVVTTLAPNNQTKEDTIASLTAQINALQALLNQMNSN